MMLHHARTVRAALVTLLLLCFTMPTVVEPEQADAQSRNRKRAPAGKKRPQPKLPDLKTQEDKLKFLEMIRLSMPTRKIGSSIRYTSADLDKGLNLQIGLSSGNYAPVIDDETFLRRVTLDLTGQVPTAAQIRKFVADPDPRKRSAKIDELLETPEYARKWARYWRSVIFFNSNANRNRVNPQALEDWFAEQFENNVSWDRITAELVSATPKTKKEKLPDGKTDYGQEFGPNNFVLACENKADEVGSQTARIFMGISIQCAECHDHPFDQWKREQFHELAAFFARGKYYMTDQDDPTKKSEVKAKFLLGEKPPETLKPDQRRVAVAAFLIYNPSNYWFARAFVNRIWSELIGDGFYSVDSLGPDAEVMHKIVANRIAAVFRYREFDVKWVFRLIMNSETYQRQIRSIDDPGRYFTAVRPTRMRESVIVDSVTRLTGDNKGLERALSSTFRIDPSVPQRDLEGSIQQALLMMNNGALQSLLVRSDLRKRLVGIKSNREMVEELYLAILARMPTEADHSRAERAMRLAANRVEAIDDLMWVLVNSTEFVTRR